MTVTLVAMPLRGWPRWLWVPFVSTSCCVKIDDGDIYKLKWRRDTEFELSSGAHRLKFFHQLGTLSARDLEVEIDVHSGMKIEYRSRFWPVRPGSIHRGEGPPR
jgi:hypothetical protein